MRTVVLWLFLILFFTALYVALGPDSSDLWARMVPLTLLAAGIVAIIVSSRRSVRGSRTNQEGIVLLNQGRLVAASEKFAVAATQLGASAHIAYFNLGIARLSLWQLDSALEAFALATKGKAKLPSPAHRALAQALLGRVAEAKQSLAEAGEKPEATRSVVEAVLAARAGDFAASFERANQLEVKQLGGMPRALAETLRAWARFHAQGERHAVDRLALFGEAGPGSLQAAWPELAAFIEQAPA